MATCSFGKLILSIIYLLPCSLSVTFAARAAPPKLPIRAVNLGGWLVTEGWIKPSLFDGITNKDLLDGFQFSLESVKLGKYLCAENGGGTKIVANRASVSGWEAFTLWRISEASFSFRVFNKQFIGLGTDGTTVSALSNTNGESETFQIVKKEDDPIRVRIKASNGNFLQAKAEESVTADFVGDGDWGDNDPSVFLMRNIRTMRGEFQVTNGYGPNEAPRVMNEHWRTFVTEEDFKFISENGLNAVRIPVGWWIASDPTPPKPYVGGSLQALDKAFSWARRYSLKIIIDLHAVQGSQNGFEHSSSRDGSIDWGKNNNDYIQQTVSVIDFLAARYANHPALHAVELMNEPSAQVSLESLKKYYKAGYDAVRKHSNSVYVIMSNRLGIEDSRELFPLASGLVGTVIDVHYYNLFATMFDNMTVQDNIDFVYNTRSSQLNQVTTSNPLTFVGEWVAEWRVDGATKEDYQRFAKSQLDVYRRASYGWAYWTLKNVANHWSMEWMIKNGYIKL